MHHAPVCLELNISGKLLDNLACDLAKLVRYYGVAVTVALQNGGAGVADGSLATTQTQIQINEMNNHLLKVLC